MTVSLAGDPNGEGSENHEKEMGFWTLSSGRRDTLGSEMGERIVVSGWEGCTVCL